MEKVLDMDYMGYKYICYKMEGRSTTFRIVKTWMESELRKIVHVVDLNDFESVLEHMLFIVRGF